MLVKHSLVLLVLLAAAAFAGLEQAVLMPPPTNVIHQRTPDARRITRDAVEPWAGLEGLADAERANALIHVEPGLDAAAPGVREVEHLWNSGNHAEALDKFRDLGKTLDLRHSFVGINWRDPLPTLSTDDWGPNVRVGSRDSIYTTAFDRNAVNGNLLVAALRHLGAETHINFNLSTDGGASWAETFEGYWSGGTPPPDLAGTSTGPHFFLAYPYPDLHQTLSLRIDASNGQWIPFPSGAWADTVFNTPGAQVTEVSMCSAEELWPGLRVYAFGRTDGDSLLYAWSDSTGQPWNRWGTTVNWCNGGKLDCAVNAGYSNHNWLYVSWMYNRVADTLHPAILWQDDTLGQWHGFWISNLPTTYSLNTSLGAWRDTVLMAYTHQLGGMFYTQCLLTYGGSFYYLNAPDTAASRELPDLEAGHGDGFALVHREYGSGRAIMYTRSDYSALNWTSQDTVSDHAPDWIEQPRVRWVAPGVYGTAYVTWAPSVYNSIWFSRSDWTGVAEQKPVRPGAFSLRAVPTPGGVRLALNNPTGEPLDVRIFDAAGRVAYSVDRVALRGSGILSVPISTSGIYFAVANSGKLTDKAKFFVAH
jgi:hypothetical protein